MDEFEKSQEKTRNSPVAVLTRDGGVKSDSARPEVWKKRASGDSDRQKIAQKDGATESDVCIYSRQKRKDRLRTKERKRA